MSLATMTLTLPLPSVTIMTPTIPVSQTRVAPICPKRQEPLCLFYDDELIDTKLSTFQSDGLYHLPTPPPPTQADCYILSPLVFFRCTLTYQLDFFSEIFLFCFVFLLHFSFDAKVLCSLFFCFVLFSPLQIHGQYLHILL